MFKDGRTNVHDEERSGRPSVVSNDLVQSVDKKVCEIRHFTISERSCEFPHILRTVHYEIITDRLGYHNFAQDGLNNEKELMEGVKTWLSSMAADLFDTGIQELIPRYDKCLNSGSDYVEK
jgi:hypothetical protein